MMVPIIPYPNIVTSFESKTPRIQNPDEPLCTLRSGMDAPFRTQSR